MPIAPPCPSPVRGTGSGENIASSGAAAGPMTREWGPHGQGPRHPTNVPPVGFSFRRPGARERMGRNGR
eukprot:3308519-Alexandrium_andersonii.AAC.1